MDQQYHEDEIDIVDYIKVIYKRRWIIITLVLVSMLFAGIFSLRKPKIYEASATFFPLEYQVSQSSMVVEKQVSIGNLIISILESRKMADRIIEQLNLKDIWKTELMSEARNTLKAASKITPEKNGIIKLSVRNKSAELSAKIANAYVDNLEYINQELDIGVQRQVVQVIDRATVPEERMPRGTVKNTLLAAIVSFMLAVFLAFFLEFLQKTDIKKRLKEE